MGSSKPPSTFWTFFPVCVSFNMFDSLRAPVIVWQELSRHHRTWFHGTARQEFHGKKNVPPHFFPCSSILTTQNTITYIHTHNHTQPHTHMVLFSRSHISGPRYSHSGGYLLKPTPPPPFPPTLSPKLGRWFIKKSPAGPSGDQRGRSSASAGCGASHRQRKSQTGL